MKALVICKHSGKDPESKVCHTIVNPNVKVKYSWKNKLTKKDLKNVDLVISIGGDGTALSASHFLIYTPLLAVNSSPKTSIGALTTIPSAKLESKINEILINQHKTEELQRIECSINGKKRNVLALNDIFIANEKAYLVSRYKIKYNKIEEEQLSSGLIFSTGTGSTAWFKSAGGHPFPPNRKFVKMIIREPYKGYKNIKFHYKLLNATIKDKERVKVKILTPSVLAIDSIREIKLRPDDIVTIQISKHPLKRIR